MSDRTINYAAGVKRPSQAWLICGITACCIAAAAIIAPIPAMAEVASYPPGTTMRPMRAAGMLFLGGAAGLLVVLPLALFCLVKGRHRRAGIALGLIGVVLGVVATVGDSYVFKSIVSNRGCVMEP